MSSTTTKILHSFINYPIVLSPIDKTQPLRIFNNDPKRHLVPIGTISPEDRQMKASETVSTVVQFRALDFGMEMCELQIVIPNMTLPTYILPSVRIELHTLRTGSKQLHEDTLSWSTRPPREALLDFIDFQPGMIWKRRFSCASDKLFTFELSCPTGTDEQCELDWWQDQENPSPGEFSIY
ncbi:hypothetical protein C8J56DRAFT_1115887 [Mycena floridula]|nr:hypothetical protein C8J56DRAFT_1115887 [Mycena floridula]